MSMTSLTSTEDRSDDRTWGTLCHLSVYCGLVIPFGNILAPLAIYLSTPSGFVNDQCKAVLNFQISALITMLLIPVVLVVSIITIVGPFVVVFGAVGLMIAWLILPIIGAVRASHGENFEYPLTIRFFK
jgi:uncharacterized protein